MTSLLNSAPLIFIHGWGCDACVFEPLLDYVQGDVRLLSYAQYDDFERQVICFLQEYRHSHVVCWSLGAMIVLRNWLQLSAYISRLTLLATPHAFCDPLNQSRESLAQMISRLNDNPEKELRRFWRTAGPRRWRPPAIDISLGRLRKGLEYLGDFNADDIAPSIAVPTTVIQGGKDLICMPAAGRQLHKKIPKSRFVFLENASHAPFIDEPQRVGDLLSGG